MMTGADAIVKSLELEGVEVIFGYPGATIAPLYDKLTNSDQIRHILVRHEQHAGHEASGYARIKNRPGVCMTTSGPGAMNLITALGTAYMDSIPIVAITGQVSGELLGRDVFQEADITGATEPFTKYSYLVKNAADLPRIIKEAFHIAKTGRPGPVLIDIPVNVQNQKLEFSYHEEIDIRGYKPTLTGHAGQIKRVMRTLNHAERPLLCIGGGVFHAQAQETVRQFVDTLNIPAVSTMMGIGAIPTAHPLYMGMLGMHGKSNANQAIADADVLILAGARVSDRAVLLPKHVADTTKIIHIDIDPAEIGKNMDTFIPVVGDVKNVLCQIMESEPSQAPQQWTDMLKERKRNVVPDDKPRKYGINPKAFVHMLSIALPDDHIYCADVGQNQIWSAANCEVRTAGRFLTSGGMGTMGYSIPCALGAKVAAPHREVVAVCGDGSFQMQMMELATLCQHDVEIKIVVMRNENLGLVREIQRTSYKRNYTAVELTGSPDVLKIASAYGIPARSISGMEEAEDAIDELIRHQGTFLLECVVDESEPSV